MKPQKPLWLVSLLQSVGLVTYISLVAVVFWKGNEWFPKMNNYFGPLLFLTLFSVSALISGLIVFGYPFTLWQSGKSKEALKSVGFTAMYLAIYVALGLICASLL